jgi:single-strand DNA-binding protein
MSNVFCATGSLGKDCETKTTASGHPVMTFSVANNVGFGDKQKTNWIRCTVWGKRAEDGGVSQYLKKGQQVFVSGELSTSEYTGNDGVLKFSIELNCNVIDLVGKKADGVPAPAPAGSYPQQPHGYAPPHQQGYQTPHAQHQQAVAQHNQNYDSSYGNTMPY